ncbi:NADH:ubiquinone oxidoreductase, membrane subunit L [Candidatus Sulfotelmatobacter kueseliae]|uniref:NADH:ubiquinone oxidoreductase, membrane subunit L n=1 Tax=Candidatus Sulfotelmatobacter kueseliae TaxID=2042962 RepID=A0A2U3LDA9_9BACT|nr:NADH:ubiquinone oxidoreductase, membrane subunit L [Candidatus Sulfotelmatobacter kueseliae]
MTPTLNLWLIPVLPLAGAAINGFFGKKSSRTAVSTIALVFCGAAFAWALRVAWYFSSVSLPYQEYLAHWIRISGFTADFAFYLDQLSLVMLLVVTGVGFLIHIYSVGYMWDDPGYYRFFSYLNLFMFFMLTLVLANNYLLMFIGWEGVGLASYLLIGFWFTKDSAASAGKKAFIVNRIGDFGFLIGLFLLIQHFGSLNFTQVFDSVTKLQAGPVTESLLTTVGILLMVGACGKSAQIPLYVWLPDAMEGPTPVSALIHAATMVTAGVYMVARSHVIFERAPGALTVVAIIGTLTALFAATIGITQTDIKKVLAYSTVSQLGYMFMACGVGAFSAGIFHLMTHAFFKGLLFLAAGSVIHAVGGEQDMRKMGGLRTYIPWTFMTMGIATLAIAGIPPFAGFWSKDEILWKAYQANWIYWLIGLVTAFITSFYMFRLLFMTFFGDYYGHQVDAHGHARPAHGHDDHSHGEPHESPAVMLAPLMILAVLSVVGGLVGIGNGFEHFLAPVFGTGEAASAAGEGASHGMELLLMFVSVLVAASGAVLAWVLYVSKPYLPQKIADTLGGFYSAVLNKYYVDELYAALFVKPLVDGSTHILWQGVDRKVIDDSINDAADGALHVSDNVRHMQSGNLRSYAGWIAAGSAVVIAYMIWLGVGR